MCARAHAQHKTRGEKARRRMCVRRWRYIILASEKPVVPGTRSEKEIQLHRPLRLIRYRFSLSARLLFSKQHTVRRWVFW